MMYQTIRNGLRSKSVPIPYPHDLDSIIKNPNTDWYTSLFKYSEEQAKVIESTDSVVGLKDTVTDKLYFDFDSKSELEQAKNDCLTLAKKLVNYHQFNQESILVHFTGSKGFSLEVNLDSFITNEQFKHVVFKLAEGLATFDKVVNDPNRIIRVQNTKHQVSKLFKIPLELYELEELSIDEIKQLAKKQRSLDNIPLSISLPKELLKEEPKLEVKKSTIEFELDLSLKPAQWKNCKWSILQGNFKSGERHSALMVLAATCKAMGYDMHTTYYMCKSAVKKQASHSDTDEFPKDELFKNIIEDSVFKEGWEGGQFTCKKDGWLKTYCKSLGNKACKHDEIDRETPVKLYEVKDGFLDFVKNIEQNTIKTGIRQLDEAMPLTIGLHCGIIGAPGSGKTSLLLDILENTSRQGIPAICASLDMHRNRFFEKSIYRVSNLTREQVYKRIKNNDYKDLMDKVQDAFKNVWFYDKSCPSVEDLKTYLLKVQELEGKKVKLVIIDYFERINSERTEDTAASKDIAGQLQDLVNDFNICLITMVQPNKFSISGGPDQPIKNYSAIKGSSFLSQSFRSIVSIWRPFYTPETKELDNYLQMAILKNDLGELDLFNFGWHGRTGKIRELSEEEEETFKNLLREKEDMKNNVSKDGWE